MRVVVGPVSSESAAAWLGYARGVLDDLSSSPDCPAGADVLEVFDDYLTEWEWAAASGRKFCWETEIPADQAEYHLHAFHQVADMLARQAERTGEWKSPEEGAEFISAVLTGLLSAFQAERSSSAAFAQHIVQFWPGRRLSLR